MDPSVSPLRTVYGLTLKEATVTCGLLDTARCNTCVNIELVPSLSLFASSIEREQFVDTGCLACGDGHKTLPLIAPS